MYKVSVPISLNTLSEENLPVYLEQAKKCKAERVFLCVLDKIYSKNSIIHTMPDEIKRAVKYFKTAGLEVGFWVNSLGHGAALSYDEGLEEPCEYTQMEGVNGDVGTYANCPLDEKFKKDYADAVKKLAQFRPNIIMLDDDFRLNIRNYYMACFCPLHLKEYYKRIGEKIPREKLEKLIFTGGRNKYRSAYLKLMADSLLDFAKMLRCAVDTVDKRIRMGNCSTVEAWDYSGTDAIEIAKAFAGDTLPFTRTAGAPYWSSDVIPVIEDTRMQFEWCKNSGVEVFSEGDTYPRPRYNVASKPLELFDFALIANGSGSGILNYLFDYVQKPDYETGYVDRYVKNEPVRDKIKEIFANKTPVGLRVFNAMHKIENWDLDTKLEVGISTKMIASVSSPAKNIISKNSIATTYGKSDYPLFLAGENAKYITKEDLKNGAVIDVTAAKILVKSGVDTGLVSEEKCDFDGEYFIAANDVIRNISNAGLRKIQCSKNAMVLSEFLPDKTPAAYIYENAEGVRFFVLAVDLYESKHNANYENSYYRQAQMIEAIEWVGRRKLPVVCAKNPNLYILASANEDAMAVMLLNVHLDDILGPEIRLDRNYSEIKFVNCTGRLEGDKVYLSDISPYGFAGFEVK